MTGDGVNDQPFLAGLAFKDSASVSIFQLSPVQIIWMLMATGAFCETGLGLEAAVPDILNRLPHNLKYDVFTLEFFVDMVVYGMFEAAFIVSSFTIMIFGSSSGNLGLGYNAEYPPTCEPVFCTQVTTCYATTTSVFLLFAWELIDVRRTFFDFEHSVKHWAQHLWGNKFLFFSVTLAFLLVFPTLSKPTPDHVVFLHHGISWE